jgi:Actinobacteria/chloroflexi VLRF1 release factor
VQWQAPPPDARHVTVASERLHKWLQGFADRHGPVRCLAGPDAILATAEDGSRAWLDVPFGPIRPAGGDPLSDLVEHVQRSRCVAVLLVRRGGYAAGLFDGRRLTTSKVGSAYVQGTTKAGGWSQQRYARRRANQASAAFAEAADAAARVLLPEIGRIEALVRGGDRPALASVLADPRLARLRPLVCGPLLAVPDPRLRVLRATPDQFLAVQISVHP